LADDAAILAHQFDDLEQQQEADTLGMWVFLATEVLFFGGLFVSYAIYRWWYFPAFAEGSHHLDIVIGTINTMILLASSFTMAMAVYSSHMDRRKLITFFLIATIVLGAAFLGFKAYEYLHKWHEHLVPGTYFQYDSPQAGHVQIFFLFYFVMTGMHAVHMIIGIAILCILAYHSRKGRFHARHYRPVEMTGLYWHFVDIVWIFLFPLLYLVERHH
jgi:cytochrome c oxidase subunit 3